MKRWWQSRTNWFNISTFTTIAGLALVYINDLGLDKTTAAWIALGLALFQTLGNLYWRSKTSKPIGKTDDVMNVVQ